MKEITTICLSLMTQTDRKDSDDKFRGAVLIPNSQFLIPNSQYQH